MEVSGQGGLVRLPLGPPMWPFLSHALFPPPTRAWQHRASSDPEAQGWGAWGRAEKPPLEPGSGDRKEGEPGEAEKDPEDAGFPLSLLEREELAEYPEADQVTPTWSPAEAGQDLDSRGPTAAAQTFPGPLSPCLEEGRGAAHPCKAG